MITESITSTKQSTTKVQIKYDIMHTSHTRKQRALDVPKCTASTNFLHKSPKILDSFTVSLHSPHGRHLPVVRAVQGDCQWPLKKHGGNSHRLREPTMSFNTRQSWPIFRPTNHGRVMPANWKPCLIYLTDSLNATNLGLCSSLRKPPYVFYLYIPETRLIP